MTHKVGCYADDPFAHLLGDAGKCRCDLYYSWDEFHAEFDSDYHSLRENHIPVRNNDTGSFFTTTFPDWLEGNPFSIGREDRGRSWEKGCDHAWRVWDNDDGSITCCGELRDTPSGLIFVEGDFSPQSEAARES